MEIGFIGFDLLLIVFTASFSEVVAMEGFMSGVISDVLIIFSVLETAIFLNGGKESTMITFFFHLTVGRCELK